jgi:hypothetical protein
MRGSGPFLPGNTGWFAAPASRTRPGGPRNYSCSSSPGRSPAAASPDSAPTAGREEIGTFRNDSTKYDWKASQPAFRIAGRRGRGTRAGAVAALP